MCAAETQTHTRTTTITLAAYTVRINASLANLCYKINPEDIVRKNFRRQDRDGLMAVSTCIYKLEQDKLHTCDAVC